MGSKSTEKPVTLGLLITVQCPKAPCNLLRELSYVAAVPLTPVCTAGNDIAMHYLPSFRYISSAACRLLFPWEQRMQNITREGRKICSA